MSILTINKSKNAVNLVFTEDKMILFLEDGREVAVPLEWFSSLRNASNKELNNWRFMDEDLLVENLIN